MDHFKSKLFKSKTESKTARGEWWQEEGNVVLKVVPGERMERCTIVKLWTLNTQCKREDNAAEGRRRRRGRESVKRILLYVWIWHAHCTINATTAANCSINNYIKNTFYHLLEQTSAWCRQTTRFLGACFANNHIVCLVGNSKPSYNIVYCWKCIQIEITSKCICMY